MEEVEVVCFVKSNKPPMNYVAYCVRVIEFKGKVKIRARGRAINNLASVVGMLQRLFGYKISNIEIGSEELMIEEGSRRVSTMEVIVEK